MFLSLHTITLMLYTMCIFFKSITVKWLKLIQRQLNCLADHPGCFWKSFYFFQWKHCDFLYLLATLFHAEPMCADCRVIFCIHTQSLSKWLSWKCFSRPRPVPINCTLTFKIETTITWKGNLWMNNNSNPLQKCGVVSVKFPEKPLDGYLQDPHTQVCHFENGCEVWKK